MRATRFLSSALSFGIAAFFVACEGPAPIDLTEKESIALVSYSLDKTITFVGNTDRETGPGLLEKAVIGKEDSEMEFFYYYQLALDSMWSQFQSKIQGSMLNVPFVPFQQVFDTEQYKEITKPVPHIFMGQDVNVATKYLTVKGSNYVSSYDRNVAKLDSLADVLGVKTLLIVDNKAEYDKPKAMIDMAVRMHMETRLSIHEKGAGIVSGWSFKTTAPKRINLIAGTPDPEEYVEALTSCNAQVFDKILKYYSYQKRRDDELETASAE